MKGFETEYSYFKMKVVFRAVNLTIVRRVENRFYLTHYCRVLVITNIDKSKGDSKWRGWDKSKVNGMAKPFDDQGHPWFLPLVIA